MSPDEQGAGTESETGTCLDLDALERRLPELGERYREAPPLPHIAVDYFLRPDVAHEAVLEVPPVEREHWINYVHADERKFGTTDTTTWGPALQAIFHEFTSPRFFEFLSGLTGIDGLIADPGLEGGGCTRHVPAASSTSMPTSPCTPTTSTGTDGRTCS